MLVLSIVLATIYFVSRATTYSQIYDITEYLVEHSGKIPHTDQKETPTEVFTYQEMPYETRYFSLIIDTDGFVVCGNFDHISTIDSSGAKDMLDNISKEEKSSIIARIFNARGNRGFIESGKSNFAYMRKSLDSSEMKEQLLSENFFRGFYGDIDKVSQHGGYIVVFLDCSRHFIEMRSLRWSVVIIGVISFALIFLLISASSKKAIQPYIDNHEKQKEFITNAGHELKTPLTIISANMEVLEMINGKSEWTESTLNQVKRLSGLVSDLITMARTEEYAEENEKFTETVDISKIVREVSDSFRPVAEKEFKRIEIEISEDISVIGDKKNLNELCTILIDNAVKYCDERGVIKVELNPRKKGFQLIVTNDFAEGKDADYSRFFERFYRGDKSHNSQKAGYGIGLSMAESITKLHKGKISVNWNNGKISFIVTL